MTMINYQATIIELVEPMLTNGCNLAFGHIHKSWSIIVVYSGVVGTCMYAQLL